MSAIEHQSQILTSKKGIVINPSAGEEPTVDGQIVYNSTTNKYRIREDGVNKDLSEKSVLYSSQTLSNSEAHQARVNLGIDGSQFVVHTDFQIPSGTSSASNTISVDLGLQLLGSVVYHVKIDLSIATSNVTGIIQTQNGESILVIAEVVTASASNYTFTETTLGVVFKKVGDTAFFIYDTTANTLISTTTYGVFPSGGTTGQVLAKSSNANGAVSWQTVAGGGITIQQARQQAIIFG